MQEQRSARNQPEDLGRNATKGDIVRLRKRINNIPKEINQDIDEEIEDAIKTHKAECRASDIVKFEEEERQGKMTVLERVRNRPENVGIPSLIVATVIILMELGLIG